MFAHLESVFLNMDYKKETKKVYNKIAKEFEAKTNDYLINHILDDANMFISKLPGNRILDLGSGPGRDALFFKQNGLNPLCFDISKEMIKLCKSKGLKTKIGDIERLPFKDSSFDGVWAYTSLLHISKEKFHLVLEKIKRILKQNGIFYMGMKEGNFEGWIESEKYNKSKRFFSLYGDSELENILLNYFTILYKSKIKLGESTFLNYLCKK